MDDVSCFRHPPPLDGDASPEATGDASTEATDCLGAERWVSVMFQDVGKQLNCIEGPGMGVTQEQHRSNCCEREHPNIILFICLGLTGRHKGSTSLTTVTVNMTVCIQGG
jgi:hypothetical protein